MDNHVSKSAEQVADAVSRTESIEEFLCSLLPELDAVERRAQAVDRQSFFRRDGLRLALAVRKVSNRIIKRVESVSAQTVSAASPVAGVSPEGHQVWIQELFDERSGTWIPNPLLPEERMVLERAKDNAAAFKAAGLEAKCRMARYVRAQPSAEGDGIVKRWLVELATRTEGETRAIVEVLSCRLGYGHVADLLPALPRGKEK